MYRGHFEMTPCEVKEHFSVPEMEGCYLLLCDGAAVTVRSQQVRALNLLNALVPDLKKYSEKGGQMRIAVIGGGAAGITFAAGAAILGGQVTLFERSTQLLHMQLGCWHRPLHPEIFTWPNDTAYRPVSHLPLLGWTTGPAHEVADTLLAQFNGICASLKASALQVRCGTAVQVTPERRVIPHDGDEPFDLVVLAVGFGVEKLPYRLPWNSYWRVDPLDQTLLDKNAGTPSIVVVGTGDGALIEIMRSCIRSLEQGALLDSILYATLEDGDDKTLREKIQGIERECPEDERFDRYCGLRSRAVEKILLDNLRDTRVHWLVEGATPFSGFSLPINRFIVSQIVALQNRGEIQKRLGRTRDKLIELVSRVQPLGVEPADKGYRVTYAENGASQSILCDNAIIRFGAERDESKHDRDEPKPAVKPLLSSIRGALAVGSKRETILDAIRRSRDALKGSHTCCHMPQWNPGSDFMERLEASDPRKRKEKPLLRARFVKGFPPNTARTYTVYRVKAWLEGLPALKGTLWVTYDLHPESGRPISRVAFGNKHEIWLNTDSNYKVRARTNDGREWDLGWIHDALKSGDGKEDIILDGSVDSEPFDTALANIQTTREEKDFGAHMRHPTPQQRRFFEDTIAGNDDTILTQKRAEGSHKGGKRGASVNIRGPFILERYEFKAGSETVVDAVWANTKAKALNNQESDSHLHCAWDYWKFAVLSATDYRVDENIGYKYQLAFFSDRAVADAYAAAQDKDNNTALFWFYLRSENHPAYRRLPRNQSIDISTWPISASAAGR
jgi:hypothetical protein